MRSGLQGRVRWFDSDPASVALNEVLLRSVDDARRVILGRVAGLSLMPYPQDADYIECRIEAIERNVPSCSLGDDKFPNVIVDSPPDEWMGFQDAYGASDGHERLYGSLG
jgi:hypothetical protein